MGIMCSFLLCLCASDPRPAYPSARLLPLQWRVSDVGMAITATLAGHTISADNGRLPSPSLYRIATQVVESFAAELRQISQLVILLFSCSPVLLPQSLSRDHHQPSGLISGAWIGILILLSGWMFGWTRKPTPFSSFCFYTTSILLC